jgi:hypothetical protein
VPVAILLASPSRFDRVRREGGAHDRARKTSAMRLVPLPGPDRQDPVLTRTSPCFCVRAPARHAWNSTAWRVLCGWDQSCATIGAPDSDCLVVEKLQPPAQLLRILQYQLRLRSGSCSSEYGPRPRSGVKSTSRLPATSRREPRGEHSCLIVGVAVMSNERCRCKEASSKLWGKQILNPSSTRPEARRQQRI